VPRRRHPHRGGSEARPRAPVALGDPHRRPTQQAPPQLRPDYPEFLTRHSRFARRLPTPTARRLKEHARRLLDAHGCCDEPLTWSPGHLTAKGSHCATSCATILPRTHGRLPLHLPEFGSPRSSRPKNFANWSTRATRYAGSPPATTLATRPSTTSSSPTTSRSAPETDTSGRSTATGSTSNTSQRAAPRPRSRGRPVNCVGESIAEFGGTRDAVRGRGCRAACVWPDRATRSCAMASASQLSNLSER